MRYLFIALFAADAAAQVYTCMPPMKLTARRITKCLLMPMLACWYVVAAPTMDWRIVAALLCGFLGDAFLLIRKRKSFFAAGLGAFAAGHVFYALALWGLCGEAPSPIPLIAVGIVYIAAIVLCAKKLSAHMPHAMLFAAPVYMVLICSMRLSALAYALSTGVLIAYLTYIGSLLFMLSDSLLSYGMFVKQGPYSSVRVMVTYILAQMLIVFGIVFGG